MADGEQSRQVAVDHKPAGAVDKRAGSDGSSELQRAMDSEHNRAAVLDWDAASKAAVDDRTAADCWSGMAVNWASADCSLGMAHSVADYCQRSNRLVGYSPADPDYLGNFAALDYTPASVLAQRKQAVEPEPKVF